MIDRKKVYIFGTGKRCADVVKQVKFWKYEIEGYIDNDSKKWNQVFNEKLIYNPEVINNNEYGIILTMADQAEVRKQLEAMGETSRIIEIYQLKYKSIGNFEYDSINNLEIQKKEETTIMFDSLYCLGWGGVEIWNYRISDALEKEGYNCTLLRDKKQPKNETGIENRTKYFHEENIDFLDGVESIVKYMLCNLPFVLINNWSEQALFAAIIVKKKYPDLVKIISVAHFDKAFELQKISGYESYSEKILCVSSKIKNTLANTYKIKQEKLVYQESPIPLAFKPIHREHPKAPLKLAFACRLEKEQKRADLLLKLVDEMESRRIDYVLSIAGKGSYEIIIKDYVSEKKLENKIIMFGHIAHEEMNIFWDKQDIYISLSDFEGTSQAMLEAMSHGVTPVVTDVSGVSDFIINGVHGCVVALEDVKSMADEILKLYLDPYKLESMGKLSEIEVWKKCRMSSYLAVLKKMIEEK